MSRLRVLNEEGIKEFEAWLAEGAPGPAPQHLLTGAITSNPLPVELRPTRKPFPDRYVFGEYLVELLDGLGPDSGTNRHLWSSLALYWFDQLCPPFATGRKLDKSYRYVLSADYRHYYRHLVRSPWQLVRDHGSNAKLLLIPSSDTPHPLRRHGEILEQLGGRQSVLRSKSIIAEATALYADSRTGRPRRGVAGSGQGSVRRFALVLRQLDLTHDVEGMEPGRLSEILPKEFDRWNAGSKAVGLAA